MKLTPIAPAEKEKWLSRDIPDRIRSCLYGLPMRPPWCLPLVAADPRVAEVGCVLAGCHEGRMTAMRWLILFIGMKGDRRGRPAREDIACDTDMRIDRLGGDVFPLGDSDAPKLAKVWLGCSQATSHPTLGTNHPKVEPPELAEALRIVIGHLDRELYAKTGRDMHRTVMGPFLVSAQPERV